MKQLLSGNEAIALGAYHAGVRVAAAYPGTPSTEILEAVARFDGVYAEWSTNEKVALEVALGACYAGARALASMKHVGLNVASDPFLAAAMTGVNAGLVVVSADDPGMHSSQDEQDNRYYARLAKVPLLEPADSQEAYDLMRHAFDISERFDTPVLLRSTTRISHAKTVVVPRAKRSEAARPAAFRHDVAKYVMLPVNARMRRPLVEERLRQLAEYAETFPLNRIIPGDRKLGIITSGIAAQYAREAFPEASFLILALTYPLPERLIRKFAAQVERLVVIEELDPVMETEIRAMGIPVSGKDFIPRIGELNTRIITEAALEAGLLAGEPPPAENDGLELPKRPPLFCPGCPHTAPFFALNTMGKRDQLFKAEDKAAQELELIITGDIGCYTLATYPPLYAMDTTTCMGASIGNAIGMEKAGVASKVVAVIGDSTFMHSGITGLVNAVYNRSKITVLVLDNGTTAMTGHQEHPGTGVSVGGEQTQVVDIAEVARGVGVKDVSIVDAFDLKELRRTLRRAIDSPELAVVIVRGICAMQLRKRENPSVVSAEKCDDCGVCLRLGCSAIQRNEQGIFIDPLLCVGDACGLCQQVCPHGAITGEKEAAA